MSNRYPFGSKTTPIRDALSKASDAAVLVFVGSLVLGYINKSMNDLFAASNEKNQRAEDLHSVVD